MCAASRAFKTVDRFAVHGFGMGIPPCYTAFSGAEAFSLRARRVFERTAAVTASVLCRDGLFGYITSAEIISAAVRFNGILGYTESGGDLGVTFAFAAQ